MSHSFNKYLSTSTHAMASEDETERGKSHHIQRACDVCRRTICFCSSDLLFIHLVQGRCSGSQRPGDKCLTCLDANLECTYIDAVRQRITKSRYVVDLEKRLEHSESLNRRLHTELAKLRVELSIVRSSDSTRTSFAAEDDSQSNSEQDGGSATLHILRTELQTVFTPPPAPHAEDLQHSELERQMNALSMDTSRRFFGKSSTSVLVKAVIDLKAEVTRAEAERDEWPQNTSINPLWSASIWEKIVMGTENASDQSAFQILGRKEDDWKGAGEALTKRRPHYWTYRPRITATPLLTHAHAFPPPDLLAQLIELYFTRAHVYIPLLHRQTFERGVEMGVHRWDNSFGALVLLVCAIGSRWSDDPRVLASASTSNGEGGRTGHLACGWEWFNQVPPAGKHLFGQATLYDLQYYCLAVHFLLGTFAFQVSWMFLGVGLRLALDAGAHRRTARDETPSVEREKWKRAFWVMVYLDGYVSSLMGRSCTIQYDDFDLDPLVECDDEYWEHPTHPFVQPPGVPSRIAFFNALLRLYHILSLTVKTLYSLRKTAIDWEAHFVADLDSALNRWRDQVPDHLSWDPERAHPVFFDQSVALNCAYYHLQILVHRSFIPPMRHAAPAGLPSMAVCTSAACACANMLDLQRQRKGSEPVNFNMSVVFTSALVLLLNVWSGKRTGAMPDPSREIAYVHKCMEVLRLCEDRWQNAGLLWDVLSELASIDQPPVISEHGQQQVAPISAEDMVRFVLKSSSPQHTAGSQSDESHYLSQQVNTESAIIGGGGFMSSDLNVFAAQPGAFLPGALEASGGMDTGIACLLDGDHDTIAMWLNAPVTTEFESAAYEFGDYFNNFSEFALAQEVARGV
ncbi:fungal-specific transcription factor domain-containing protein [Mycena maculata]|uniref:Fungal-specific transcription factor domain-containing protein n=1 Tax=Mycena maculata TaxID=230809 RepID=A0AAD7I0K7_9AGAR|nr:fungal-specific transcription factor domain-containing protein [Mycena maculata]